MRRILVAAVPAIAMLALALAGCASKPAQPDVKVEPPPQSQINPSPPVTPRRRAELHTDLAAGYYERGQMNVALDELKEAQTNDATYANIYNVYGLVYTMLGEDQKAEMNFQRALSLAPNDSDIRHNWGAYLCAHGRAAEAIPEFEQAARDPLYKTPEVALTNAGKCSVAIGNTVQAETYYRRALSLKPQDPNAAYNLALLKYRQRADDEARVLMKVIMGQTNPPPQALYLGMCIERRKGDVQSADSYVQQIRNRYPQAPEAAALDGRDC